jgi:hypothetical protein
MKTPRLQIGLRVASLTVLLHVSCSSPPATTGPVTSGAAYETRAEIAGETTIASITTTNTLAAIDLQQHTVQLRLRDGSTRTYVVGPEIVSFNKLHVGDLIRATVVEEMAVDIRPPNMPESTRTRTVVSRVNSGGAPAVRKIDTYKITAKILAIDPWLDQVTLQLAGGVTRTVQVNEYVNLANMNVGDDVSVTMVKSTTLALEKP